MQWLLWDLVDEETGNEKVLWVGFNSVLHALWYGRVRVVYLYGPKS